MTRFQFNGVSTVLDTKLTESERLRTHRRIIVDSETGRYADYISLPRGVIEHLTNSEKLTEEDIKRVKYRIHLIISETTNKKYVLCECVW
jgi:hypothetical protein